MKALLKKLQQESTWRGIITVAGAFGIAIKPDLAEAIIAAALGLVGLINIIKND